MDAKEKESSKSLLGVIHYASSFLEKLRIAQCMQNGVHSLREIEYLTGLKESQIEWSPEAYKQVRSQIEKVMEESFWDDRLTKLFFKIGERKDDANSTENTLRKIFDDNIEKAKRETRLQIAYKMLHIMLRNNSIVFLGGIASITNLSIEEVECLADIRRIRVRQERSTLSRVVKKALQAQLDKTKIAKIVDLDAFDFDDLIKDKDNEEDIFDFSFLQKPQSNIANNQLSGEGS